MRKLIGLRQLPLFLLALPLILYGYLGWNSSPPLITDSYGYLSMANSFFSFFTGESTEYFSRSLFPPLYPLFLAVTGGANNFLMAHLGFCLLLAGSLILYFFWLRSQSVNPIVCYLLLAAISLSPSYVELSFTIMSESLYLLLTLLALLSFNQIHEKNENSVLLLGLVCSLALLTRAAAIALVIPVLVYFFLHKVNRRYFVLLIIILPNLFWAILKSFLFPSYSYMAGLIKFWSSQNWSDIFYIMLSNLTSIYQAWNNFFNTNHSIIIQVLTTLLLPLCVIGLINRLLKKSLDAYYLLFYLTILVLWPFPDQAKRFLSVVLPFLLFYTYHGFEILHATYARKQVPYVNFTPPILFLILTLVSFLPIAGRLLATPPAELTQYKKTLLWTQAKDLSHAEESIEVFHRLVMAIQALPNYVPHKNCIYFSLPPIITHFSGFHAKELPIYSDQPLSSHYFPECNYILLSLFAPQRSVPSMYPIWSIQAKEFQTLFSSPMENGKVAVLLIQLKRQHSMLAD